MMPVTFATRLHVATRTDSAAHLAGDRQQRLEPRHVGHTEFRQSALARAHQLAAAAQLEQALVTIKQFGYKLLDPPPDA